jgi:hypothetical protein
MTRSFRLTSQPGFLNIGDDAQCPCFRLPMTPSGQPIGPVWLAKKYWVRVKWMCPLDVLMTDGCANGYQIPNGLLLTKTIASEFAA